MPTTRSQADAIDTATREEVPASVDQPGGVRSTQASRPTATNMLTESKSSTSTGISGTTSTENTSTEATTSTENSASTDDTAKPPKDSTRTLRASKKTKSRHSGSEKSGKSRKLKDLEIKEKLAALKLEEIRASLALARIQAEKQRAVATDEEDLASASENEENADEEERSSRVQEWLEDQPEKDERPEEDRQERRGQGACSRDGGKCEHQENDKENNGGVRSRDDGKCEHWETEARPARQPPAVDVTSLAAALTQAVKMTRDAPKYLQELPFFNGQTGSWLTFRAAYQETEALFTKTENVSRLRRCLKGAAHEAVSSLLISSPDPKTIVEALERRFGRPDAIAMSEMQKIKSLGKLSENPRELCLFANKLSNIVAAIEALNKMHYLYNPESVKIIMEKLTPILRNKWYDYAAKEKGDIPDLKRLAAFLNEEADKCGAYAQPEDIPTAKYFQEKPTRKYVENTYSTELRKINCPSCKQEHYLAECKNFRNANLDERWEMVKNLRVCFQCLKGKHQRSACKGKKCGQDGCYMAHHRLLHRKREERAPPTQPQATAEVTSTLEIVENVENRCRRAYLKVAPVTLSGPTGVQVNTYALLDDGSTISLIDQSLADILQLDGPRDPMWIQGINETAKHENSQRVNVKIRGKFSTEEYTIRNARTVPRLTFAKQNIERKDLKDCTHLRPVEDQLIYVNACPKLLIGQDNWELLLTSATLTGKENQPVASNTRLGWVLHGSRTSYLHENIAYCSHTTLKKEENEMENLMKKFYDLEALGIEPRKQKNDPEERALKILREKSTRLPDGRFETSLLWQRDDLIIPNNYESALNRLKSLEKKLDRDAALKEKYEERIENLLSSGYAEKAGAPTVPGRTWYLPHFAVCNPSKPKIRLVHDAAARSHGWSLNDMLISGPDLLQSLPGVIMRFRQHPYAVSADIKEMFMQIRIREEDRDALRFLWRGNSRGDTKPDEYRMTSVIFGATSSPCTALYIKNRNAEDFEATYPEAVKEIKKNHYMDDYITSFPTVEQAIRTSKNVDYVHRQGGFVLRGWTSNEPSVLHHFNTDTETETVPIGGASTEKTLGLLWEVEKDCIGFRLNIEKTPREVLEYSRPPTKREALSVIMSLFDPLGLVSPLTTPAKRLMQETWRYGTGWDELIPDELQPRWTAWLENLRKIENLHVPRCYNVGCRVIERHLHVFVDASQESYATSIYLRMKREDGTIHVVLVAGKSRVAPLKPTSIPRLELQAALLGTRLAKRIIEEHEFELQKIVYWTDSRTVLAWIRSEPRTFKTFVAHRLAEIEESTKINEWRWVPTKDNVADDATRDTPKDFNSESRWFRGPDFLRKSENEWPQEIKIPTEITGEEKCCASHESERVTYRPTEYLPNIDNISKWVTLVRSTARVLQFIDLVRRNKQLIAATSRKRTKANKFSDEDWKKSYKKNSSEKLSFSVPEKRKYTYLNSDYVTKAEKLWVRAVQEECYKCERERIIRGRNPNTSDRLINLSIYLDADGLLRLRGRVKAASDVAMETADPALLDGAHKYTRIYIQYVHEKMSHGGVELTVNELRQRFWINRIRPTVKSVIRSCQMCRIRKAKPMTPSTGDLPPARLSHHTRPFSFTGLDYFGPMETTVGRHREKRWVALFTCLTVRAVHLEVVPSLSADSAISALRRFMARRGAPTELWTDNATCFKGANKELMEATKDEASARCIRWCNIPATASFMAGAWERMVRSVKDTLRIILNEKYPSDETLITLLAEVENIVNSRPLTHVSVEPDEPEALTPNHILMGPNSHVPAPGHFTEEDGAARKLWRRAQHLADEFWRRWMKEYLPVLQNRREPRHTGTHPKVGDLVLICDPNLPRNVWPRGRVTRVYPGPDGEVRVVDVTTSNGHVLKRPTRKIVVLPVDSQTSCAAGEM